MVTDAAALRMDRRAFLTAASTMLAAGLPLPAGAASGAASGDASGGASGGASGDAGPRLAAIDWAMLETAIAIGHMPVAACELIRFRADSVQPEVAPEVTDLGLRGAPNFELLQLTRPDLILTSPYYTRYQDRLEALAPVLSLPFFVPGEAPLPKALAALDLLADAVGDRAAGQNAQAATDARLAQLAATLAPQAERPVCLVNIGDARHLRAFGFDSLFGSTLDRLGLQNAWSGGTRFSFLAPVPIEELAALPEARLVIIGDIPPEARRALSRSVLWQALPPVAKGRLYQLPQVNAFGGVPSALRFAQLLAEAFAAGPIDPADPTGTAGAA